MSKLYDRLVRHVGSDHPAIIENDEPWSYQDLCDKINALADALQKQGIQAGDRVAIVFMNDRNFFVSFYALLRLGAVVVPINVFMPPEDICFVLQHSQSKLIITTDSFSKHFTDLPIPLLVADQETKNHPSLEDAIAGGDPKFSPPCKKESEMDILIYTSGTTGKPKGVMVKEENFIANIEGLDPRLKFTSDVRALLAVPLFHAYGLIIGLYCLDAGAMVVLVPNFAPKKIVHALITHQVSILPLVPTMFSILLQAIEKTGRDAFSNLKMCVSGGASLPKELLKKIETLLNLVVIEGYGMTETATVLCVNDPSVGSIPASVGKPLDNIQVKVVDEEGKTLPQGQEGELLFKGPNIMQGYYQLPEENKAVFDGEGYIRTGDLGLVDATGNVFISGGRIKDLIIKSGENISPLRIENVLYQHPAVQEASVIGIPDEKLGEDIMACIQLKADFKDKPEAELTKDIQRFCREQLTPLLTPQYFKLYDELPKNPAGKILKKVLKAENKEKPVAV